MKRSIKIGKRTVPLWIIGALLISIVAIGVSTNYLWKTIFISVEVKEPLEILSYPSTLSLYPGETEEFNITIENHASANYSVVLDFSLDNTTYQDNYVTFGNEIYAVIPGQQNLTAWLMVKAVAPPVNASLTIDFKRGLYPSGLVGYWRFDEGSGTIAFDSSGESNHGILVNNPIWVNGKFGKALGFDGLDDYVQIGPSDYIRFSKNITVATWVKVRGTTGDHQVIVSYWEPPSRIGFVLEFAPNGVASQFAVEITDGTRVYAYSDIPVTIGSWVNLVGVFDGSVVRIYVNGTLAGQSVLSGSVDMADRPILIGAHLNPGDENWFNGVIDEISVYNRVLSSEEVEALHESLLP